MELRMQDLTFDMGNDITAAVKLLKRPMLVGEYTRVMFQVRDRTKTLFGWCHQEMFELDEDLTLYDFFLELIPSEHKHEEILQELKDYMLTNNPM